MKASFTVSLALLCFFTSTSAPCWPPSKLWHRICWHLKKNRVEPTKRPTEETLEPYSDSSEESLPSSESTTNLQRAENTKLQATFVHGCLDQQARNARARSWTTIHTEYGIELTNGVSSWIMPYPPVVP